MDICVFVYLHIPTTTTTTTILLQPRLVLRFQLLTTSVLPVDQSSCHGSHDFGPHPASSRWEILWRQRCSPPMYSMIWGSWLEDSEVRLQVRDPLPLPHTFPARVFMDACEPGYKQDEAPHNVTVLLAASSF